MTPSDIISYWFSLSEKEWFSQGKSPELDQYIIQNFGPVHTMAEHQQLSNWETTPDGRFALIILFDQMSRHIYRKDMHKFYSFDGRARTLADISLTNFDDKLFPGQISRFYYFPFIHSENIDDLNKAKSHAEVRNYERIIGFIDKNINTLSRFGRYPWRNAYLKRKSTPEELEWLTTTDDGKHKLELELFRHKFEDF